MAIQGNTKKITVEQANTLMQGMATANDNRFQQKEEGKGLSANDFTNTLKDKLDGVAENANNYSLPDATDEAKGGVIVGNNIDVNNGTISVANGTTAAKGVVQLEDSYSSTATTKAATPAAVKAAYDLANGKQSPQTSIAGYGITDAYTKTEVDNKIAAVQSSAYHAGGSKAAAELTSELLVAANDSKVYNLTTALTITAANKSLFTENAEGSYPMGTNVAVINTGTEQAPAYKFDVMAGFVDLSDYATLEDVEAASAQDISDIVNGLYAD